MCFTSGGRHREDAKCGWGTYREITPLPAVVPAAADEDAADVQARYESAREIEQAIRDEERKAEALARLERELHRL